MRTCLLLLLTSWLLGCEQRDTYPRPTTSGGSPTTSLPLNAVTFVPANWQSYVGDSGNQANPNKYQYTRVTGTASSNSSTPVSGPALPGVSSRTSSYTLGMAASTIIDTASYGYWAYSFYPPTALRVGRSLTLTAKVRLDSVAGKGVSLVLRGNRSSQPPVLFATTENKLSLKGTADFTEYSVTLPYSTDVEYLTVYLVMLSNTTGSASFTDMSITIQ